MLGRRLDLLLRGGSLEVMWTEWKGFGAGDSDHSLNLEVML